MRRHWQRWIAVGVILLVGCGSHTIPRHYSADEPPEIRVGLQVGVLASTVECSQAVTLSDPRGTVGAFPAGGTFRFEREGRSIRVLHGGVLVAQGSGPFRLTSDDKQAVMRQGTSSYPGYFVVRQHSEKGLNVINVLDMETYLRSVIPKEIPSAGKYQQAARAQAVAARTYALKCLGKYPQEGFDVYSGVLDQVYGSIEARNPTADEAVLGTRGQTLLYQGQPIEAKYSSTCGGRMASIEESFYMKVPYLPSGKDKLGGHEACRDSKYYRWKEEWSGEELWATLERSIPEVTGDPLQGSYLKEIKVTKRGDSGRAVELRIKTDKKTYKLKKEEIRRGFRRVDGGMMRSTAIDVDVDKRDGRIVRIKVDGKGWGHGVGMCQWGAMGLSAEGRDYAAILRHYYPKTSLQRVY